MNFRDLFSRLDSLQQEATVPVQQTAVAQQVLPQRGLETPPPGQQPSLGPKQQLTPQQIQAAQFPNQKPAPAPATVTDPKADVNAMTQALKAIAGQSHATPQLQPTTSASVQQQQAANEPKQFTTPKPGEPMEEDAISEATREEKIKKWQEWLRKNPDKADQVPPAIRDQVKVPNDIKDVVDSGKKEVKPGEEKRNDNKQPEKPKAPTNYKGSTGSQELQKLNPSIKDVNKIYAGQELIMPDGSKYTVKPGDTLDAIASKAPAAKPEAKPEVKPEAKPEVKPEAPAQPITVDKKPEASISPDNPFGPKTDPKIAAWEKLTPAQKKWMGGADPTDPIILSRLKSALPNEPDPLGAPKPATAPAAEPVQSSKPATSTVPTKQDMQKAISTIQAQGGNVPDQYRRMAASAPDASVPRPEIVKGKDMFGKDYEVTVSPVEPPPKLEPTPLKEMAEQLSSLAEELNEWSFSDRIHPDVDYSWGDAATDVALTGAGALATGLTGGAAAPVAAAATGGRIARLANLALKGGKNIVQGVKAASTTPAVAKDLAIKTAKGSAVALPASATINTGVSKALPSDDEMAREELERITNLIKKV